MRHSDMINSIVEAEHHAREIVGKAEEKRKALESEVAQQVRQLLRAMSAKAEVVELLRFLRYFSAGHPADFSVDLPEGLLRRSRIRFERLMAQPDYPGLL